MIDENIIDSITSKFIVIYNFRSALGIILKKQYIKDENELIKFIDKHFDEIDVVLENKPLNYDRKVKITLMMEKND